MGFFSWWVETCLEASKLKMYPFLHTPTLSLLSPVPEFTFSLTSFFRFCNLVFHIIIYNNYSFSSSWWPTPNNQSTDLSWALSSLSLLYLLATSNSSNLTLLSLYHAVISSFWNNHPNYFFPLSFICVCSIVKLSIRSFFSFSRSLFLFLTVSLIPHLTQCHRSSSIFHFLTRPHVYFLCFQIQPSSAIQINLVHTPICLWHSLLQNLQELFLVA